MMHALIVSESESLRDQVRQRLLREGFECPVDNMVTPGQALARLALSRPDVLVLVLSPDPERSALHLVDLRAASRARILAVGPTANTRLVLSTLRSGADDYVDEAELDTDLPAVLGRLKNTTDGRPHEGRLLALLAPSGGSGSSTLAVNLATVLAKEHQNVMLADMKLHSGDLAALLDLRPTHSLGDLSQNAARMDRVMFERSLVRHDSGVQLLASPQNMADVQYVTPEAIRQSLVWARALFPYIVADLDHTFRPEQMEVLQQADLILLVLRLDFPSLRNTRKVADYLERLGISRERLRLVVNRYGQPKEVPAAKAEEALGVKFFHYVPDDPKSINRANNNGVPVVLEAPSAKVSKSLARLAASINGHAKSK
jgi:pilus assembly protein CpaE